MGRRRLSILDLKPSVDDPRREAWRTGANIKGAEDFGITTVPQSEIDQRDQEHQFKMAEMQMRQTESESKIRERRTTEFLKLREAADSATSQALNAMTTAGLKQEAAFSLFGVTEAQQRVQDFERAAIATTGPSLINIRPTVRAEPSQKISPGILAGRGQGGFLTNQVRESGDREADLMAQADKALDPVARQRLTELAGEERRRGESLQLEQFKGRIEGITDISQLRTMRASADPMQQTMIDSRIQEVEPAPTVIAPPKKTIGKKAEKIRALPPKKKATTSLPAKVLRLKFPVSTLGRDTTKKHIGMLKKKGHKRTTKETLWLFNAEKMSVKAQHWGNF